MAPIHYDVAVVGLGALGSAAAYHATKRGAKVIAFEQFELGHVRGASHDTSRIVRTSYEAPEYVALAKSSYRDWRQLEEDSKQKLLTITGGVVLLPKDGPGVPAPDEWTNSIPTARQWAKGLDANNLPYEFLDHEQANKRWPQFNLKEDMAAIYSADTGIVHAAKSVTAMQFLARLRGAEMKEGCKVHRVIPKASADELSSSSGVTIETSQGTFSASKVVLAADGWVNELLEPLGLTIPLKVTQEQVTYFRPTNPRAYEPDRFPVWIWVGKDWYYGFPAYGEPTIKAGHDNAEQYTTAWARSFIPSQEKIDGLDSAMQYFMPDKGREQMRTVTCLYTRTPGRQFVISPIKEQKDIIVLMGAAHAFKFAPTIGRAAAELAIDGETKEDISKFSLDTIVKPFQARTTAGQSRL